MDNLLVSVIVPVYNGELYLAAALDSIFAQDYSPFEVILVDDGSTDETATIASCYPGVRYFYQANQGPATARNNGVAMARGEFLTFADSDDTCTPNRLQVQVGYLLAHPDAGYVLSHQRDFLEPGAIAPAWLSPELMLSGQPCWGTGSLMVRRDLFSQVGGFDPRFLTGEDIDWFVRAKDAGIVGVMLPETLLLRRIHGANLSECGGESNLLKILRASISRQRAYRAEQPAGVEGACGE